MKNTTQLITTAALAGLVLAGCGTSDTDTSGADHAIEGEFFAVEDPWIKATEETLDTSSDHTMTGAFVHLTNVSGEDQTIVAADAAIAELVELHEVIDDGGVNVMQEKPGGFPVAADQRYELNPGADHIMLMDLADPISPGDLIEITLELENGETQRIEFIAKEYVGAQENYGDLEHDHADHDHGDDADHDGH